MPRNTCDLWGGLEDNIFQRVVSVSLLVLAKNGCGFALAPRSQGKPERLYFVGLEKLTQCALLMYDVTVIVDEATNPLAPVGVMFVGIYCVF